MILCSTSISVGLTPGDLFSGINQLVRSASKLS